MRLALISLLLGLCAASAADVNVLDEIIAKINGDIITRSEIERSRRQLEAELRQRGVSGEQLAQTVAEREKDIFRDRIDSLLLVQKAKELSINVDGELSKYMADIQRQSGISDTDKFQQWLRDQSGMPFEDFKSEARNGMLTQRVVRQEVGKDVNISKAEVQKYYDEHKTEFVREERVFLREILVSTAGKDAAGVAAAEKKAQTLVARARKGEKFPELARDNSDSETAKNFGEIGGFKRGELDKTFENLVFGQPRGHVTDPIKREPGFVILKVEEIHKAGQAALEEVENEIMEKLYTPRFQPAVRKYLTKLRTEAFLEIREGYIDSGAAPGKNTAWTDPAQLRPETVTKEEVASRGRRRRLLWMVPIPGTRTGVTPGGSVTVDPATAASGESKSKTVEKQ